MALYPVHKYFIFNGELKCNETFTPSENEGGIYEVFRTVNGMPLFFDEHIDRFFGSASLSELEIPFDKKQIKEFLKKLIQKNNVEAGNVLLSFKTNLKAFFIPHKYPVKNDYFEGVTCGILKAERKNPNAKVFQTQVRIQANTLIQDKNYYEVLLTDHKNRITEGSRSNVFFVKNNQLLTPPAHEVLLGITRQKTFQLAKQAGIQLIEDDIFINDLGNFNSAFITGTSPKLLPVKSIENVNFNPNNTVVQQLIKAYEKLIQEYILSQNKE
jgi:branched-chain amino acid aminotransferase